MRIVDQNVTKGGQHLGKPSQTWISPNRGGEGSRAPPDPYFNHIKKKIQIFEGGGGQGLHQLDIQILFW